MPIRTKHVWVYRFGFGFEWICFDFILIEIDWRLAISYNLEVVISCSQCLRKLLKNNNQTFQMLNLYSNCDTI